MLNYRLFTYLPAALLLIVTSCSPGVEEDLQPEMLNENVHVSIRGAIAAEFHNEDSNLHDRAWNSKPYYRDEEMALSVQLSPVYHLNIILYNSGAADPLTLSPSYSAYPHFDIPDKLNYTIVQLMKEGSLVYSTTFENAPALIQPNVFEWTRGNGDLYSIRLRDLTMFDVDAGYNEIDAPGIMAGSIVINGTFKIQYPEPF